MWYKNWKEKSRPVITNSKNWINTPMYMLTSVETYLKADSYSKADITLMKDFLSPL